MTLPTSVSSDDDAAPPRQTPTVAGWRRLLDNDPFVYAVTFCVMVACCLLVPKLLNNMIFVIVMLALGVVIVPQFLKKHLGPRQDPP